MRKRMLALLLALTALLLSGCAGNIIEEDAVKDDLPLIHPNEGVGQDVTVTLFFRLLDEKYLVPVTDTVTKRPSELTASAVVERLMQGPSALQGDLKAVVPPNTRAVEVYTNKDVAYVTLSKELEGDETWSREDKYLSVCAVVNSLLTLSDINRVQVMIDRDGGGGMRLTPLIYGFEGIADYSDFLGPLAGDQVEGSLLTPARLVARVFTYLMAEDLPQAYQLFAEGQKPSYAAFETQILSLGVIEKYTLHGVKEQAGQINAEATVDIVWTDRAGVTKTVKNAVLQLVPGERYRMGYSSLISAMGGEAE